MSLGSVWQSVERHHTSLPLMIVNVCALVPTFSVQSVAPLLVSVIDSCGFWPAAYVSWSVTACTAMSRATQGFAVGVSSADASGDGAAGAADSVGVVTPVGIGSGVGVDVERVGVGAGFSTAAPRQGWAMSSHTSAATATRATRRTSRRRR